MGAAFRVLTDEELATLLAKAGELGAARALASRPANHSEWIGDDEVAAITGYAVAYVRKLRDLPVHRVGRKRRYRRSEIDAYIARKGAAR